MINLSFSLDELELFLLVLVRVATFVLAAPFFSTNGTPRQVKIGFTLFMSFLLYRLVPGEPVDYETVLGYAIIVLKEAMTGLIIGFGANICTQIITFAGHLIDMETGLSMVSLMDPMTHESVTISGIIYQNCLMLMLFISGLYQYVLMALKESYVLIPVNGVLFTSDKLLVSVVTFLGDYLIIGFRICLPIFCSILLVNCILGILAKVSPQLNMFAVGIQIKILCGLAVMFITVGLLPEASAMILSETKKVVSLFVEGMQ